MKSNIEIPKFAKIKNYRTMDSDKKNMAVSGQKKYQLEWMKEEINEFYEAVSIEDNDEIMDEAIGLMRTAQQFSDSKRVLNCWHKVKDDVKKVFKNKSQYNKAFKKWKHKKTLKNQAKEVTSKSLLDFYELFN